MCRVRRHLVTTQPNPRACLLLGTRGRLEASSVTELRLCSETMNRLPPVLVLLDASLALAPDLGEGAAHAADAT